MTPAQIDLLKRLINADRRYYDAIAQGIPAHRDDRGVEVGAINGVNPRTAETLVEAGLAEILDIREGQRWIFLGDYDPYKEIE